jgi:SAM-dependent methyltransferase
VPPAQVNPVAVSGFTTGADAYERARPSYPSDLLEVLRAEGGLVSGARVVDLAAGTGKLTRLLDGPGVRLVGIEPVTAMATTLVANVPGVPVASGLAEALPLADASVDLLTVAQGFHWFDTAAAFAECLRVIRPGGRLSLIWNERDDTIPWCARFTELLVEHGGGRPYERTRDWAALAAEHGFVEVVARRFDNPVETDRQGVVDRAASTSFIGALPDDRRAAALAAVAELVSEMSEPFDFPHVTDLTLAVRPS